MFQSVVTRNPLGSPDVIGLGAGAAAGAAAAGLVSAGPRACPGRRADRCRHRDRRLRLPAGARGGVPGARLVLVGIAVGGMLVAVTDYLLTRATLELEQVGLTSAHRHPHRPRLVARRPIGARARRAAAR